jgi:hypothetical protein
MYLTWCSRRYFIYCLLFFICLFEFYFVCLIVLMRHKLALMRHKLALMRHKLARYIQYGQLLLFP